MNPEVDRRLRSSMGLKSPASYDEYASALAEMGFWPTHTAEAAAKPSSKRPLDTGGNMGVVVDKGDPCRMGLSGAQLKGVKPPSAVHLRDPLRSTVRVSVDRSGAESLLSMSLVAWCSPA